MISEREYMAEIDRIARDALEAEHDGYNAEEYAEEEVYWHSWTIYAKNAAITIALSSSEGENFLDGQDLNETYRKQGLGGLLSLIAFACMMQDVQERINDLRRKA